ISAPNVTVQGLDIVSFSGDGIALTGSGGDTIQGNFVGTDIHGKGIVQGNVSVYPMDGNANDVVGSNNPSATNAISFVPGKFGQGVTFGSDGYIEIPDSASLDQQTLTFAAWVRPDGPGTNNDDTGNIIINKALPFATGQNGQTHTSLFLSWRSEDDRFV